MRKSAKAQKTKREKEKKKEQKEQKAQKSAKSATETVRKKAISAQNSGFMHKTLQISAKQGHFLYFGRKKQRETRSPLGF